MTLEINEWVALGVVASISLLLVLLPGGSLGVFLVLALIALLVIRALAGLSAPGTTNTVLDAFIAGGLIVFVGIVLRRVFDILAFE